MNIEARQGQETTKNKVHILSLVIAFSLVLVPVSSFASHLLSMDHLIVGWQFSSLPGILCHRVFDTQGSAINQ